VERAAAAVSAGAPELPPPLAAVVADYATPQVPLTANGELDVRALPRHIGTALFLSDTSGCVLMDSAAAAVCPRPCDRLTHPLCCGTCGVMASEFCDVTFSADYPAAPVAGPVPWLFSASGKVPDDCAGASFATRAQRAWVWSAASGSSSETASSTAAAAGAAGGARSEFADAV
jgi:hypothetical protein